MEVGQIEDDVYLVRCEPAMLQLKRGRPVIEKYAVREHEADSAIINQMSGGLPRKGNRGLAVWEG